MVAQLLRHLRRVPQRLLHPLRRRQAHEAVARHRPPQCILVVCHGNICRSPFAAAELTRALGGTGVRVMSAGFVGPDRSCPREAVAAAARRGVDLSSHRSALLTANLVSSADLIVVMDEAQRREVCGRFGRWPSEVVVLGDLDPLPADTRAIRDPVEQKAEVFDESYARIARCIGQLARALRTPRRASG
jgi:protein-tyrosine-phosphatase